MRNNYGIIGYPLDNDLSPLVYGCLFSINGINGGYNHFSVKECEELPIGLHFFERFGFSGLSVSAPHRYNVIQYLYDVDASVRGPGVVDTVKYTQDGWIGYNTDVYGFSRLLDLENVNTEGDIMIFGAGAAAASAIYVLLERGARSITVVARNSDKVRNLRTQFPRAEILYKHFDQLLDGAGADVVINTLPVDWSNKIWRQRFWPDHNAMFANRRPRCAVDFQYFPWDTAFLSLWDGSRKINGCQLLVEKAIRSFEIWFGAAPDCSAQELCDMVKNEVLRCIS